MLAWGLIVLPSAGRAAAPAPSPALLVDAEAAFQQAVSSEGIRAGFLRYLAASSVGLTPPPVPGPAHYQGLADRPGRLLWRPDLAAIALAGDLGFTSGPWLSFKDASTAEADAGGYYLSVWRRDDTGRWQVWLDGGIREDAAAAAGSRHLEVKPRFRALARPGEALTDCGQRFAAAWKAKGRARALEAYAADDLRLLEDGRAPLDGRNAVLAGDRLLRRRLEAARPARRAGSESRDLTVVNGEYDIAAEADRERERLGVVQIWQSTRECRLALELTQPLPP